MSATIRETEDRLIDPYTEQRVAEAVNAERRRCASIARAIAVDAFLTGDQAKIADLIEQYIERTP